MSLVREFWDFMKVRKKFLAGPYIDCACHTVGFHYFGCQFARCGPLHLYALLGIVQKRRQGCAGASFKRDFPPTPSFQSHRRAFQKAPVFGDRRILPAESGRDMRSPSEWACETGLQNLPHHHLSDATG